MSSEEQRLESKILYFEDMMFRCKGYMNTRKLKLSEKKYLTCVFNYRELDLRI